LNKPRILFTPAREHTLKVFNTEVWGRLEAQFDIDQNDTDDDLTPDEIRKRIVGCQGIVTGWGVSNRKAAASRPKAAGQLTIAIMDAADSLKIIAHSAGSPRQMLKEVWHDYIVPREICVFTATAEIGYNVAETAVGMMIMSAKNLLYI
jgi:phosphoglycerate dehydrogenase-like enzyme